MNFGERRVPLVMYKCVHNTKIELNRNKYFINIAFSVPKYARRKDLDER